MTQLKSGEISVLATFPSSRRAQEAAEELGANGIKKVQVDRISRYGAKSDEEYNNPLTGRSSPSSLSLYSADTSEDTSKRSRVLLGSDPSVSGYGATDYGQAGGQGFLVTVVCPSDQVDKVRATIAKHGGTL